MQHGPLQQVPAVQALLLRDRAGHLRRLPRGAKVHLLGGDPLLPFPEVDAQAAAGPGGGHRDRHGRRGGRLRAA